VRNRMVAALSAALAIGLISLGIVLGFASEKDIPDGYTCGSVFIPSRPRGSLGEVVCQIRHEDRERWVYLLTATGGAILVGLPVLHLVRRGRGHPQPN